MIYKKAISSLAAMATPLQADYLLSLATRSEPLNRPHTNSLRARFYFHR